MAAKTSKNFRLNSVDLFRLSELSEAFDCSETEIVSSALDLLSLLKFDFSYFKADPQRSNIMGLQVESFFREHLKEVNHD